MISHIRVVLFDLGNTLFYDNSAAWPKVYPGAEAALWRVLRKAGVMASPETLYGNAGTLLAHYYALRGDGVREPGTFHVLSRLLAAHGQEVSDTTITHALQAMYSVTQRNWRVEREAAQTLRAVQQRGFRIGAVSNGSDDWNAQRLIDRARLRRYFELVLTSAAHGWRKPDGRIFQAALDYFHAEPGEAVMIGDSYEADILGAGALGIRTVWITKRAATADVRPTTEPDATLRTLKEIPGLLS